MIVVFAGIGAIVWCTALRLFGAEVSPADFGLATMALIAMLRAEQIARQVK